MHLNRYYLKNFRRLENVEICLNTTETIFVGPNNSGKTSAAMAFRLFVSQNRDFQIHDFSSSLLKELNEYGNSESADVTKIPSIDLDLWFSLDEDTEYGRIADFMPTLSSEYSEVGVRISFSITDPKELLKDYLLAYPKEQRKRKPLSDFLGEDGYLRKYFNLKYFQLASSGVPFSQENVVTYAVDREEGKNALQSLLRVDYVDAQRNIDDAEAARSNRLSSALADYYKFNLEHSENDIEALEVIDKSNENLSEHYEKQFSGLIETIKSLGFPSANDRDLKILSTLKAESALRGNTTLLYIEKDSEHRLPEAYNGLGFKNLIFIAIQISHFQKRWLTIEKNRPLCQIIFVEEPEVHLHAQVQQTFIRQISDLTKKIARDSGDEAKGLPQLLVSTHSSHIVNEAEFQKIRYFQRTVSKFCRDPKTGKKIATRVLNLAQFDPDNSNPDNIRFLQQYLKLTHCDLFFSDAAILVEGAVEKLLLPKFIEDTAQELKTLYLTILEVGGAYAHKLLPLLDFIGLPTLVITDLDSVDPTKNRTTCRADLEGAISSNKAITYYLKKEKVADLLALTLKQRIDEASGSPRLIAFQKPVSVSDYGPGKAMTPRTFEEAFIYENLGAVREKKLAVFVSLLEHKDFESDYNLVFDSVRSKNYKKVEFALNQIETKEKWKTPEYVVEGLIWLKNLFFEANSPAKEPQGEK